MRAGIAAATAPSASSKACTVSATAVASWAADGSSLFTTASNRGQSSLFAIDVKTGRVDTVVGHIDALIARHGVEKVLVFP